jgi:hypothetical protein
MGQGNAGSITRFQSCGSVMTSQVGDELILLNLDSGIYHSLNAVGVPIWTELTNGKCPAEIVDALVAEYDVTSDVAARDVQAFVGQLLALGLVQPS